MPPIDRILKVEGQVPPHVGVALADLAYGVSGQLVIVDIGAYRGRSACYLAYGANQGDKAVVHAIDPWDLPGNRTPGYPRLRYHHPGTRKAARYNVRAQGFSNDIVLTRDWSGRSAAKWETAGKRPVGLLHIDGDPDMIKNDILAWWPNMAPMGVIAVSDYHKNGTASQAVAELAADNLITDYSVSNGLILIQIPPKVETVHAGDHVGFSGEWAKVHDDPIDLDTGSDAQSDYAEQVKAELAGQLAYQLDVPKSQILPGADMSDSPDPDIDTEPEPFRLRKRDDAHKFEFPEQRHVIDTGPNPETVSDRELFDMTGKQLRDYMRSIGMKLGPSRPKRDMVADIRSYLDTGQ